MQAKGVDTLWTNRVDGARGEDAAPPSFSAAPMKSDEMDDSGGWQSAVDCSSPATVGMQPIGGVGVGGSPRLSPLGFLSPLDAGATNIAGSIDQLRIRT